MHMESSMSMAVVGIVAVLFAAVAAERLTEAWRELMDTLKGATGAA